MDNEVPAGWMTLAEAAQRIGCTKAALHKRVVRKRITAVQVQGVWYVQPPDTETASGSPSSSPEASPKSADVHGLYQARIQDKDSEIRSLRELLARRDEELVRRDEEIRRVHILLQQTQQVVLIAEDKRATPWWRRLIGRERQGRGEG